MADPAKPSASRSFSRRSLLKAAAISPSVQTFPYLLSSANASTKHLTIVLFGGTFGEAITRTAVKPFEEETGINVRVLNTPDLAKVKAQVVTGNVEWDLFDGDGARAFAGSRESLWEVIPSHITAKSALPPGPKGDIVGYLMYSGSIVHMDDGENRPRPTSFADFWDVKAYPGRRAILMRVNEMLEMALVADGVDPKRLYPLDIDRAFRSLDRIKPYIRKFIEKTTQSISLLQTGEVDYSYTFQNRVHSARKDGYPLKFMASQTITSGNYFTIPKGAPNKRNAKLFLEYVLRRETQARICDELVLTPANPDALTLMRADIVSQLPSTTDPDNILMNYDWWSDRFLALDKIYKEWLLL